MKQLAGLASSLLGNIFSPEDGDGIRFRHLGSFLDELHDVVSGEKNCLEKIWSALPPILVAVRISMVLS
jgi:hypothetical protein